METTATRHIVRVELLEDLLRRYEIQANGAGAHSVEDYLAERLKRAIDYDAVNGIYLKDADRHELEQHLGRNFSTAAELLGLIRNGVTIKVGGADVVLDQTTLKRAEARAAAERLTLHQWLAKEALQGIERTCGLR